MTVIDTSQTKDRVASLFNTWVNLNEETTLEITFSIPHITYDFAHEDFLCGNILAFEIQKQDGSFFSQIDATNPVPLSLQPQVFHRKTVTLPAGLYRLGVRLTMGMEGKIYLDNMLLAVKKA